MASKKGATPSATSTRLAVRMIQSWETHEETGDLSIEQALCAHPKTGLRRVRGRLPTPTSEEVDDARCRLLLYSKEIDRLLAERDVRVALEGVITYLMSSRHDFTVKESAARVLVLIPEVLEPLLSKQRSINRWAKVGTRTELRRSLQAGQRAVRDITSAIKQVDVVARELRAIQRKHDMALHRTLTATSPMLLADNRDSALGDLERIDTQLKAVDELLKRDIGAKRQVGGKLAQFDDAIMEIDMSTRFTLGAGLESAAPRRLIFQIIQAIRPDLEFTEDALRRAGT